MCDKLVFDLAQEIEGSPQVFVRKDWLNILDNQNQNYNNNQSILDTSQLSNSNKWMNYREAYLLMPLTLTIGNTGGLYGIAGAGVSPTAPVFGPTRSIDYAYGLKNWFGSMIHSFTLDYNGTTIIQQTPLSNMWNSFKLMTSLSYGDLLTQGDVIGFYPDDSSSWEWNYLPSATVDQAPGFRNGTGVCNNTTFGGFGTTGDLLETSQYSTFNSASGNPGYIRRIQNINFDLDGISGLKGSIPGATYNIAPTSINATDPQPYGSLFAGQFAINTNSQSVMGQIWKSFIFNKTAILQQTSVMATVYLKQLHSFFNMVPLLKGVFMKMTMNLNNASTVIACASYCNGSGSTVPISMACTSVSVPSGGINPIMVSGSICSAPGLASATTSTTGSYSLFPIQGTLTATSSGYLQYTLNVSVGAVCLNSSLTSLAGILQGPLSKSVYLYIPAYTFNPPFESSYLSSPVKVIKYTDIYQYQVLNITSGGQFNNLVTNGIANIKSVLILPYYSVGGVQSTTTQAPWWGGASINQNTGFTNGIPVYQSPFDPAGTGPTSPLCLFSNFNIQISGQNAIYNVEKYSFEQFNNQLYGQHSVNGGLTDGLTSGLVGRKEFDMEYCYYYVNVERMLPVEETVPKSVQILGTNQSGRALDLFVFVEYGMEIKIDAMTGARV